MADNIPFERDLAFEYGRVDRVAPGIRRVVARNPSAFTFHGTGTYILGEGKVAVIDPGPDLDEHFAALMAAIEDERVSHILVTHTHRDHSPLAARLKAETGAPTYGFGPHGTRRAGPQVEEGADYDFDPDIVLRDGERFEAAGRTVEAVHTPGHTSNHLCFALPEDGVLFSGDHVMGWSTTVVSPPDGDMHAYFASLKKLLTRDETVYWPTHGTAIRNPERFVSALIRHRRMREEQIMACLTDGLRDIPAMVARMYAAVPQELHPAARQTVLAHLIHMVETDRVRCEGPPAVGSSFRPA
jgi:glyoxylase-like metal-dependent hydrolase (beta-lactamase superfamily II)